MGVRILDPLVGVLAHPGAALTSSLLCFTSPTWRKACGEPKPYISQLLGTCVPRSYHSCFYLPFWGEALTLPRKILTTRILPVRGASRTLTPRPGSLQQRQSLSPNSCSSPLLTVWRSRSSPTPTARCSTLRRHQLFAKSRSSSRLTLIPQSM